MRDSKNQKPYIREREAENLKRKLTLRIRYKGNKAKKRKLAARIHSLLTRVLV